jgi:hypothetical protein
VRAVGERGDARPCHRASRTRTRTRARGPRPLLPLPHTNRVSASSPPPSHASAYARPYLQHTHAVRRRDWSAALHGTARWRTRC